MQPGPAPQDISQWVTEVYVNGIKRPVEKVTWDGAIDGDLPEQVAGGNGGISGTSGTVTWGLERPSNDRPVSPWNPVGGWPPKAGDEVVVWVSDGPNSYRRGTWLVDVTSGDAHSGFSSKVIDRRDRITGTFTQEALLRHMVPWQEDDDYRSIGLNFWYTLTAALRGCGFYNVPPIEGPSALSVPMQGSVWPEAGTVLDAGGSGGTSHAGFFQTDFGYAAVSFEANYLPRLRESTSEPVQISLVVPPTHFGTGTVDVIYGQARSIRLRVNSGRTVTAFFSPTGGSPWTTVATLGMGSGTIFTLLIKNGAWTLRTDEGTQSTGTQALGSGSMSSIRVVADGDTRFAGLQVSHPTSVSREFASLDFEPNMIFQPTGLASTMDMAPALKGRKASDIIDEILKATLTAAWWDEAGRLILRPSDALWGGTPTETVDTEYDITKIGWSDSLLSIRSAVNVKWKSPAITKGRQWRTELWRGAAESMVKGDLMDIFIEPESGIEWFGVDRAIRWLTYGSWGVYNNRRGSMGGYWFSDADGEEDPALAGGIDISTGFLYADSLRITANSNGMLSFAEANSETSPSDIAMRAHFRGKPLPVIRGMGRGEWVDATYRKTAGLADAPILEHTLGYWGQEYFVDDSVAERIGDFLAQQVTNPSPLIDDLELMYDPRRQLGDVFEIESNALGVLLKVLIVGIKENLTSKGATQSLSLRVIRATATRDVTYEELQEAWGPSNYSGLQAAWAALNYDALDADPLEGAPS